MNQTRPTRQRLAWMKWLAVGALVIAVPLVALWLIPNSRTSAKIQARINAIKLAGYPVTAEDLQKLYPPLPDDQNSALIYQKAFLHLIQLPSDVVGWPVVNEKTAESRSRPLAVEISHAIANYVNANHETLSLLHQASTKDKGQYWDISKYTFSNYTVPPLVQMRASAQLLALDAISHSADGQAGQAARSISDLLSMMRPLDNDPLVISQIVKASFTDLSCNTLEWALNHVPFSDDELRGLSAAFTRPESTNGIKTSLFFERAKGIWGYEQMKAYQNNANMTLEDWVKDKYIRVRYYRENDFLFYLDIMEQYIAVADLPYPQRIVVLKQLKKKTDESGIGGRSFGLLMLSLDAPFNAESKEYACSLLARSALAIERYRLANQNQIPGTLQDLVPTFLTALPADPFDGQPLRYRKLPKGYLIYSIGEDGVDDGGKELDSDKKTGDLTFTVER